VIEPSCLAYFGLVALAQVSVGLNPTVLLLLRGGEGDEEQSDEETGREHIPEHHGSYLSVPRVTDASSLMPILSKDYCSKVKVFATIISLAKKIRRPRAFEV
jgi:hypothetical protein